MSFAPATRWRSLGKVTASTGLLALLLFATAAATLAQSYSVRPLKVSSVDANIFRDPDFVDEFLGNFGFLPDLEPKVAKEETELMTQVIELMQADTRAALQALKLRLKPDSSAALFMALGNLYLKLEEREAAEKSFLVALKKFPKFRRAEKSLALLHAQGGKLDKARTHALNAIKLGDQSAKLYAIVAYAALQKEEFLTAQAAYEQAFLREPDNPSYQDGLVSALVNLGRYDEAAKMLDGLIVKNPSTAKHWLQQANCYIRQEEHLKAAVNYEVLRHMDLADSDTLYNLGKIYLNNGMTGPALGAFLNSMAKAEDFNFNRTLDTAKLLGNSGAHEKAARFIGEVKKRRKDNLSRVELLAIRTVEAEAALAMNRDEDAIKILEDIIKLDPMSGEALIQIAKYYEKKEDYAKARFYFERALKDERVEYDANFSYAYMLVRKLREYEEALPLLERALELNRTDGLNTWIRQVRRAAKSQSQAEK